MTFDDVCSCLVTPYRWSIVGQEPSVYFDQEPAVVVRWLGPTLHLILTALLSDSPGAPFGGRFVIHWREEDSRHVISGKIADGFYGR